MLQILKFTAAALVGLWLHVGVWAAETFVVGVNNNDKPFCWINERGELTGFSYDMAQAICRTMGAQCRFVPTKFADFLPNLVEKRLDFAVANMLRTPEREKQVDFTNRFWRSSSMFVGKPGIVKELTASALKGKTIALQRGTVQEKYVREHWADSVRILSFATNVERNAALAEGKADLMFATTTSEYAFLVSPQGAGFEFIGAPIDGQGLGGDVAIPLTKGRDDLRVRLNTALETLLRNGTLARLSNQYFSSNIF